MVKLFKNYNCPYMEIVVVHTIKFDDLFLDLNHNI